MAEGDAFDPGGGDSETNTLPVPQTVTIVTGPIWAFPPWTSAAMSSVPPLFLYEQSMAFSWAVMAMTYSQAASGQFSLVRPNPMNLHVVASVPPSMAPAAPTVPPPLPTSPITMDAATAVHDFVALLMVNRAGAHVKFEDVRNSYRTLSRKYPWPELSSKALSQGLSAYGCSNYVASRQKDGSRPTVVIFPKKQRNRRMRK